MHIFRYIASLVFSTSAFVQNCFQKTIKMDRLAEFDYDRMVPAKCMYLEAHERRTHSPRHKPYRFARTTGTV